MIAFRYDSLLKDTFQTFATSGMTLLLLGFFICQQLVSKEASDHVLLVFGLAGVLAVLIASRRMQQRISTTDSIEKLLSKFGRSESIESLLPVLGSSEVARSWNSLIREFHNRGTDQAIERRLERSAADQGVDSFGRALRSLPEGVALSDLSGNLLYSNPAWQGLLNLDSSGGREGENLDLFAALSSKKFANWQDVEAELLDGTMPIRIELNIDKSLAEGVYQLSRFPLEGRSDETDGFIWTLRDITHNVLAREAHEQFLAAATHELRTPITNIKAYSESLIDLDNISLEKQREFFNVIHSEADRLNRLLNQLLDIQQLEAGSMTLKVSAFDVQRMVADVQDHILPLVAEKQHKLVCRIAPDLKTIQADKEKVISCLLNLLGNAIKYTPAGGEIRLIAEQQEVWVTICVEDNGIGISQEELPKIFDRFYRSHDERVLASEGNGLGLAFSAEVARLHHGELSVESQRDHGSRFILRIPCS